MQLILFETAVIAQRSEGDLLIALIDGKETGKLNECVALLTCPVETARSLCKALGSALKDTET